MRLAQPVLGYPSRSAACRALRAQGLSNGVIVARFVAACLTSACAFRMMAGTDFS